MKTKKPRNAATNAKDMTADFAYWTATDLATAIRTSKISPVQVIQSSIERIHQVNDRVNAYCFIYFHL